MENAHPVQSGLRVSRVELGAMNFGDATGKDEALSILDRTIDPGVNHIDTADVSGGPQTPDMVPGFDTGEEIIDDRLLAPGRSDEIVLATQLYQSAVTAVTTRPRTPAQLEAGLRLGDRPGRRDAGRAGSDLARPRRRAAVPRLVT